jgi:cytidyltransferase-like protein
MKFREFLTEARPQGKVIVVYGGGFQPFHAGHMSSYEQAKRAFPSADFYVAASNDTKNRPIPFKDKQFLAQQAGVQDHFVQVSQPVNPTEILSHYNPKKDILILVRSERDPVNYTKKDGSQAYYQPFKSLKDCVPFNPDGGHGYVYVTKKHVFKVNGEEVYSGSQIRSMYSKADDKGRKSIINGLYPKATKQVKVKQLLDKYIGGLNEQINLDESFNELLFEGVHDKSIFKVVFLAGGPGSGKDYVLDNTLAGHGMTEMNSDKALEFLMDKNGLDKTMPASEEEKRNLVRGKAKNITELRQRLAILGRNGLIINGTGDDVEKITKIKKKLEEVGYDSSMVLVNTDDEVSKQRNIERGQRGGRTVPENIRKEKWDNVQNGRPEFAKLFGDNYMEFDNSEDLRKAPPEVVKAKKDEMLQMYTKIKQFVSKPPENPAASAWVAMELQKKDTLPVPKNGAEQTPHADSGAAEEARKMGLKYYGFGRYGQNGTVTHRVVHDKLVEVEKEPQKEPNVPTSGSSMKKSEPKKVNEQFEQFLSESEDELFSEEKKVKLLRGHDGKPRIFLIRRSAAKESHLRGGEVMKHPKGYVIKIKEENDNVETNQKLFEQSKTTRSKSTSTFLAEGRISNIGLESGNYNFTPAAQSIGINSTEQGTGETNSAKTKITISQIRAKQKEARENHQESIDQGIETGLSMAASGENLARPSGEKINFKKRGKASIIDETIGAGGEDATSNSDEKELEFKRKGINLKSFKANRSISS